MVKPPDYDDNVFINCPDDEAYKPLFHAIVFTVIDCGFNARCALEERYSAQNRLSKIEKIISECKYGIHDISRTELDQQSYLPRFNMPLELGIFLGAIKFGQHHQKNKKCLILDREPHRYQQFVSDIGGQDIASHNDDQKKVMTCVRDWLLDASRKTYLPSGCFIWDDYIDFQAKLPGFCQSLRLDMGQLTFLDYATLVAEWLKLAETTGTYDKDTGQQLRRPTGYAGMLYPEVTDLHKQYLKALGNIGVGTFVDYRQWIRQCKINGVQTNQGRMPKLLSPTMIYGVFASRKWIEVQKDEKTGLNLYCLTEKGKHYLDTVWGRARQASQQIWS